MADSILSSFILSDDSASPFKWAYIESHTFTKDNITADYGVYDAYDLIAVIPSIVQQTPTGSYYHVTFTSFGRMILLLSSDWAVTPRTLKPCFFAVYSAMWLGYSGWMEPNIYYDKTIYPIALSSFDTPNTASVLRAEGDSIQSLYNYIKIDIYGTTISNFV